MGEAFAKDVAEMLGDTDSEVRAAAQRVLVELGIPSDDRARVSDVIQRMMTSDSEDEEIRTCATDVCLSQQALSLELSSIPISFKRPILSRLRHVEAAGPRARYRGIDEGRVLPSGLPHRGWADSPRGRWVGSTMSRN